MMVCRLLLSCLVAASLVTACSHGRPSVGVADADRVGAAEVRDKVGFRATGNEPAWILEITREGTLLLVTDYGKHEHRFQTDGPAMDTKRKTVRYTARAGFKRVKVDIQMGSCRDSMSGEAFAAAVTVELDGKIYRGCGRGIGAPLW